MWREQKENQITEAKRLMPNNLSLAFTQQRQQYEAAEKSFTRLWNTMGSQRTNWIGKSEMLIVLFNNI